MASSSPPQKIIVFGFPHCGTTIFRNIMGHIEDVDEMYCESRTAFKNTNKPFVVTKYPFTWDQFFRDEYKDYIKIFIIRNPLWIFSSLNKRFQGNIPADHNMYSFFQVAYRFVKYTDNPIPNTYLIRYEDMFHDNFAEIRRVFDAIGLKYTDDIFDNSKYENVANISPGKKQVTPTEMPQHNDHNAYRAYQVNQPFVNNNDMSKLQLNHHQKYTLRTHPEVKRIYPEIDSLVEKLNRMEKEAAEMRQKEAKEKAKEDEAKKEEGKEEEKEEAKGEEEKEAKGEEEKEAKGEEEKEEE